MPIPLILGGAALISGAVGLSKGKKALSNNREAKDIIENAKYRFESKKEELERKKEQTAETLSEYGILKLNVWNEQIGKFVKLFENIKKVDLESKVYLEDELTHNVNNFELKEMKDISLKAGEVIAGGVQSLGVGALAGVASYGGAMMFGTASTGTAIASLTGVAATNATLAWLGGGSLAAGGLGVAGGTMILGGLVAGPVLVVGGMFLEAKSKKRLAEAEKFRAEVEVAIEQIDNAICALDGIQEVSNMYKNVVLKSRDIFNKLLFSVEEIINDYENRRKRSFLYKIKSRLFKIFNKEMKINFDKLSEEEKKILHTTYLYAQTLVGVLEYPLLNEDGSLEENSINKLKSAEILLLQ